MKFSAEYSFKLEANTKRPGIDGSKRRLYSVAAGRKKKKKTRKITRQINKITNFVLLYILADTVWEDESRLCLPCWTGALGNMQGTVGASQACF